MAIFKGVLLNLSFIFLHMSTYTFNKDVINHRYFYYSRFLFIAIFSCELVCHIICSLVSPHPCYFCMQVSAHIFSYFG